MSQEVIIFSYIAIILISAFTILISVMRILIKDSQVHIEGKFVNNLKGFNHLQSQRDKEFEKTTKAAANDRARIEHCISLIEKLNR